MGLEPDMELTPNKGQKLQSKYGSGAGSGVDPPHELRWDIDRTGTRDRVGPKLRSKSHNPNMDLELDPNQELTPYMSLGET